MSFILENVKKNRLALAIFNPSIIAAIKHYFPNNADSAEFLDLVNTRWIISSQKKDSIIAINLAMQLFEEVENLNF